MAFGLDKNAAERFREQGFLKLPQLSNPNELATLREIYDELFAGGEGERFDLSARESDKPKLPQILDPGALRPELRETEAWRNAGEVMRQLLAAEPTWRGDHAILKPANYGAPTPWHQDEAYWDPACEHFTLSVWMPLQDVDEASGCMHFIPGSQRLEVLPHRPIGNDAKVHGLELSVECPGGAAAVPLKAGEATVHGGRTLHFAPPNKTDSPRRAYIMMGGLPGRKLAAPRRFEWQEKQRAAGAPAS